jgi:DNA polymerase
MPPHSRSRAQRIVRQRLESLERAGVSVLPQTTELSQPTAVPEPRSIPTEKNIVAKTDGPKPKRGGTPAEQLAALAGCVAACTRCEELAQTRTQTVFGVGNPEASIMFIGEAPGADEDRTGEPFVGRAGQLLDRIVAACNLKREDIYICNILRCRPPGNRNPSPEEAANCREYLDAQIEIVDPDYIVCWGSVAAKNLLDSNEAIGRMRGKFFKYGRAKVACTYHPSYLLRNPPVKKDVWDDMKFIMRDMGVELD